MGSVYVAEHVLSKKRLAVKVVHPYLCRGREGVERFRREVSAAAEIDHPGIVQVYDAGVDDDGGFFMAMELLHGESLGDRLRRSWPGMATAVAHVVGMLEPLAKAHAKGFVHRDLKPDNIFLAVDEEGRERVKLLDFGLARVVAKSGPTQTGITFGTPEYMSPEQAMSARKVRSPGDVWSIAVMLYELVSGRHPFLGETPTAIMANAIKDPHPPVASVAPHVPEPLADFIDDCLAKDPESRPQDAGAMLTELRLVLAHLTLDETVPKAPTPPSSRFGAVADREAADLEEAADEPPIVLVPSPARATPLATEVAPSPVPPKRPSRALFYLLLASLGILLGVTGAFGASLLTRGGGAPAAAAPPSPEEPPAEAADPGEVAPVIPTASEATEPELAEAPDPAEGEAASGEGEAPPSTQESAGEATGAHGGEAPEERPAARVRASRATPDLVRARECYMAGDMQCVIRVIQPQTTNEWELLLLIQAYRRNDNLTRRAKEQARRYLDLFPHGARAEEMRRFVSR